MSFLRIPMVLWALWSLHVGLTPPQKPALKEERAREAWEQAIELFNYKISQAYKWAMWGMGICETLLPLTQLFPSSPCSRRIIDALVADPGSESRITVSSAFLVGWVLVVLGGMLRARAYRELGSLYTYEVSVKKEHRLVTTGPYAIVRHPSYVAFAMVMFGSLPLVWGQGSWFWECGAAGTILGKVVGGCWVLLALVTSWTAWGMRPPVEDRLMEGQFGDEWRRYAKRVPSRIIPGIY